MPNITTVNLTAGVPTGPAGAATVSTLDALMADGGQATLGVTTGAAVITDANGTIQQYLRGLIKQWIAGTLVVGAGQNTIGNVGGKTVAVTVTPTVTASNAYGVNYVVGGLLTFANAFTSTGSGILQSVSVNIKKVESVTFWFVPFASNPSNTTWTDAAVAAINAADVAAVRAPIQLTNNSVLGTHTNASAYGLGLPLVAGSTSLYGVLIVAGTLTNNFAANSDLSVTVKILQDA